MYPNITPYDLTDSQKLRLLLATASPTLDIVSLMHRERFVLGAVKAAPTSASRDSLSGLDAELAALPPPPPPLCELTPQPSMLEAMGAPAAPEGPVVRHHARWSDDEGKLARAILVDHPNLTLEEVATRLGRTMYGIYNAVIRNSVGMSDDACAAVLRRWKIQRSAAGIKLIAQLNSGKRTSTNG